MAGSSLASVSRMTQARWPSAVAGGALGLVAEGRLGGRRVDDGQRPIGPRQRLLHVRLGVAHQLAEERQGVRGDLGIAAARAVHVRHRRDGRADEAALPARRAVDELLELRPAIGLGDDALAVRVGERVDGDPVTGFAGRATEELPGPLGLDRERALEEAEGEPAGLELHARGRADRRRTGVASVVRRGSRCGSRAGLRRGAASGRRGRRRCRARCAAARRGTPDRRACARPACQGASRSASGSLLRLGERGAERLGRVAMGGDECDGPGGHLALGRGRRSRSRACARARRRRGDRR